MTENEGILPFSEVFDDFKEGWLVECLLCGDEGQDGVVHERELVVSGNAFFIAFFDPL